LNQAIDYITENQNEAKIIMADYLHESQKPFVEKYPNVSYQKTTETSDSAFQEVADKYLEIGIINEELNIDNLNIQ